MIFEVTGVPGSGKTTFISRLVEDKTNSFILFSPKLLCNRLNLNKLSTPMEVIVAELFLYSLFLLNIFKYRSILFTNIKNVVKTGESFVFKINITRNIVLKIARYEAAKTFFNDKDILFDEGISHIPFNTINYKDFELSDTICSINQLDDQYSTINVFLVDHTKINIVDRLIHRGHTRLTNSDYSCERFCNINKIVAQVIVNSSQKFRRFLCLDPTNDLKSQIIIK